MSVPDLFESSRLRIATCLGIRLSIRALRTFAYPHAAAADLRGAIGAGLWISFQDRNEASGSPGTLRHRLFLAVVFVAVPLVSLPPSLSCPLMGRLIPLSQGRTISGSVTSGHPHIRRPERAKRGPIVDNRANGWSRPFPVIGPPIGRSLNRTFSAVWRWFLRAPQRPSPSIH